MWFFRFILKDFISNHFRRNIGSLNRPKKAIGKGPELILISISSQCFSQHIKDLKSFLYFSLYTVWRLEFSLSIVWLNNIIIKLLSILLLLSLLYWKHLHTYWRITLVLPGRYRPYSCLTAYQRHMHCALRSARAPFSAASAECSLSDHYQPLLRFRSYWMCRTAVPFACSRSLRLYRSRAALLCSHNHRATTPRP